MLGGYVLLMVASEEFWGNVHSILAREDGVDVVNEHDCTLVVLIEINQFEVAVVDYCFFGNVCQEFQSFQLLGEFLLGVFG